MVKVEILRKSHNSFFYNNPISTPNMIFKHPKNFAWSNHTKYLSSPNWQVHITHPSVLHTVLAFPYPDQSVLFLYIWNFSCTIPGSVKLRTGLYCTYFRKPLLYNTKLCVSQSVCLQKLVWTLCGVNIDVFLTENNFWIYQLIYHFDYRWKMGHLL